MNHQTQHRANTQNITSRLAVRTTRIGLLLIAVSMIAIGVTSLLRRVSAITAAAPATVLVSAINGSTATAGNASAALSVPAGYRATQAASRDGRYIVFRSAAADLTPNDNNGTDDVFVRDLQTNTTTLVSMTPASASGNSFSGGPIISGNGLFVAFSSQANNLTNDACGGGLFVRNLQTNTTKRVNGTGGGGCSAGAFSNPSFSFDGRYLAFDSNVGNLDPNVTGGQDFKIYVRDLIDDTTAMVSVDVAGTHGDNGVSNSPSMSDDGKFVAFVSTASNLTTIPRTNTSSNADVYIRNLTTKKTAMVSVNSAGAVGGNNGCNSPLISGDGQTVVFRSDASDLVTNDTNNHTDIFARKIAASTPAQLTLGPVSLVSINSTGTNGGNNDSASDYDVTTDGRYVAFDSNASDLVMIDSNGLPDVFRRDLQTNTTNLVSIRSDGTASSASGGAASFISSDERFVVFTSAGGDLVNNSNGQNVFIRNFYTGATTLASIKSDNSTSGQTGTAGFTMSKSGNTVAFNSGANDLVFPGVSGGNVYARTNLNPQVPAAITLTFDGKLRDRVGHADNAINGDGQLDGTFTVQLQAGTTTRQVVSLDLNRGDGNEWDTISNANWVLGTSRLLDGVLLNNAAGLVNFTIADGENFKLFASDNGNLFVGGKTFTVLVRFSDGAQATANVTIPNPTVDLDVQVSDSPDPVVADSTLTYTISVMNKGTITAPNVMANTAIPTDTNFILSGTSQGCVRIGTTRNVQCSYGNIVAGDTISKQIAVRPTGHSTPLTFNVSVASDLPDSNTANNSAIATSTVGSVGGPPANDDFSGPVQLSGTSGTVTGTNVGATRELPIFYGVSVEAYELNHASQNGGKSVWYFWTPPTGKTGSMSLNTSGSNFDTLMAVYSIDTTNAFLEKEIASNDDVLGSPISAVDFSFDSRHVYYVVVDGKQGDTGQIKLNWRAVSSNGSEGQSPQKITKISPLIACTSLSDAPDICNRDIDAQGYFVLKIQGHGFASDSQVLIKGVDVINMLGTDRNGTPISGTVTWRSESELEAHIPPNPPLGRIGIDTIRVVTSVPATGRANESAPLTFAPETFGQSGLADGTYRTATGSRGLQLFEALSVEILPGATREVCVNVAGSGEMCMTFKNTDTLHSAKVSPTYFAAYSTCLSLQGDRRAQCTAFLNDNPGFSVNMRGLLLLSVRKRVDVSPDVLQVITGLGGRIAIGFEGGVPIVGIVSDDGASLVASGGGNLIATGGGNLIATGGGNVVSNDSAGLITNDGGTLITNDGGTLITNDGGTLIGQDGGTFTVANGQIGSGANGPGGFDELLAGDRSGSTNSAATSSSGSNSNGVSGMFLASGSGGQAPTFTTETDPVTGEVKGYISMTFDDTSFPRGRDFNGIAFTVLVNPSVVQFATNNVTVDKAAGRATVTITRSGDKSGSMTVDYATGDGTGNDRSDYSPTFGSVTFAPGETSKDVTVPLINHGYGSGDFGAQRNFHLIIVNVVGGAIQPPNYTTITITNNQATTSTTNPLVNVDPEFFVRQHYLDFLGREPDQNGLNFWKGSITSCGSDQPCLDVKRINASAAFFLSIEFQHTGYFVERIYKAAYGSTNGASTLGGAHQLAVPVVRFNEFLLDRQQTAAGVIVGQAGWEALLDSNKGAFAGDFVKRSRFVTAFPSTMTEAQFVAQLNSNVGGLLSTSEVNQLLIDLNTGTKTRAQALRAVADNSKVVIAESNRAFVLMQFFGYLRRNPNEGPDSDYTGFEFWLNKLNSFNGDYINAEMVKAFITSGEYRNRFGH
jgi:uncharacterized repeat protein (TIGR01451 family)